MMKYILCVLIAFYTVNLSAQVPMPEKLVGTWKSNLGPFYEQWQKLNDSHFKGVSWYFSHGFPIMMEYLDITAENGQLTLCATVPGQNEGRKVCFAGRDTLSGFIFENLQHDFPKKIAYQFTAENEIRVRLAGDPARDFSFTMEKLLWADTPEASAYDAELARQLGADTYGMRKYIFVLLKSGSRPQADTTGKALAFKGHLKNIQCLASEKKLLVAGPFFKNESDFRGIFIFNTTDVNEAQQWLATDPAIEGGWLAPLVVEWYGSAALPLYLDFVDKVTQQNF
ncbi:MAG: hypothetical protein HPY80_06290 [Bacteroidales bacterium]|jgi:uncharacterized protein YciI|nr:hypothetical protein [Bacteroidales bacterium]NPV36262.1 hypothetical protein [Bacteroidales bacterium]